MNADGGSGRHRDVWPRAFENIQGADHRPLLVKILMNADRERTLTGNERAITGQGSWEEVTAGIYWPLLSRRIFIVKFLFPSIFV